MLSERHSIKCKIQLLDTFSGAFGSFHNDDTFAVSFISFGLCDILTFSCESADILH